MFLIKLLSKEEAHPIKKTKLTLKLISYILIAINNKLINVFQKKILMKVN